MKKLLLIAFAITMASCSSSTEPSSGLSHRMPGVGSTFVMNDHDGPDSIFTIRVDAILPLHLGRDNVIQLRRQDDPDQPPVFIDFEADGDVALGSNAYSDWVILPIGSKAAVSLPEVRTDNSTGYYTTTHTSTPKGIASLTIKGKTFASHVATVASVRKYYDMSGVAHGNRTWSEDFYWVPEIGFFGKGTYIDESSNDVSDLVDYTLK